jgi:polyferredoxin
MYQKRPDDLPRAVKGWFARWRWVFVWLTQLLFYGMPWLQWDGRQAVLFDLEAQRFYILGLRAVSAGPDLPGGPTGAVRAGPVLLHGRGRAAVVRLHLSADRLHRDLHVGRTPKFEGDRIARMRLDQAPWSAEQVWPARAPRSSAWVAIGLFTGFSFVGYFTPIRELAQAVADAGP